MQANYVSLDLIDKLKNGEITEGYISSVYPAIFTVTTDEDELIYFLNNKKYIAPMSVVLEDLGSFNDLNLTTDTKVIFENTLIMIDSHKIEIEINNAKSWNPKLELLEKETSEKQIKRNLLIIEHGVVTHGKYEGFAPVIFNVGDYIEELKSLSDLSIHNNLYSSFISEKIIEFIFKIVNNDLKDIGTTVNEFIGFGPGMTPSSDDFLCGFMASLMYLGKYYELDLEKMYKFNKSLLSEIELDNSEMSHSLLIHYSKGNAQKMIKNLINSIIYERDLDEMCKSIREVINFGDISGTDMLCGVYIGTRLIKNSNIKRMFA